MLRLLSTMVRRGQAGHAPSEAIQPLLAGRRRGHTLASFPVCQVHDRWSVVQISFLRRLELDHESSVFRRKDEI
jgi:hypothetical protein